MANERYSRFLSRGKRVTNTDSQERIREETCRGVSEHGSERLNVFAASGTRCTSADSDRDMITPKIPSKIDLTVISQGIGGLCRVAYRTTMTGRGRSDSEEV
jgi:hypothetical protein